MSKRISSQDLTKKVSATSANDLVVKVKSAAAQLAASVKTAQANFNERASAVRADAGNLVSAINVIFDIDNFAAELISSGVIIDDVTLDVFKELLETPILSDVIAQKDVTKILADIYILNDSLALAYSKALQEITSTSDNADLYLNKIREDTLAASESLSLLINKALTEVTTISQDDTVQYIKLLGSTVNTAPTIGYFVSGEITFYVQVGPGMFSPVTTSTSSISGVDFATDTTVNSSNSLSFSATRSTGVSSTVSGYISGGYNSTSGGIGTVFSDVRKINISTSTLSSASFLHNTSVSKFSAAGVESDTRGYYLGGHNNSVALTEIDGVQFSNDTYINPASNLTSTRASAAGFSSLEKGYAVKGTTLNPTGLISNLTSTGGITFATETSFQIATVTGVELESASSETTTRGYVFGGHYNQSRVTHLRFADETYNIDGVSLLSARESSAGLSSASSGYIGGGTRSDIQKFNYANSTVNTIAASLSTNTLGPASIQPKLNRQTTAVISDRISKNVSKPGLTDTARASDTTTKQPNKGLSDTARAADDIDSLFVGKNITQDISRIAESIVKYYSKELTDTASNSDVTTKLIGKGLSETPSISESITKIIEKHLADNITTFEGVTGFDGVSYVLDNTESNTSSAFDVFSRVVDYVRSGAAYNLTDTSTVTDTITSKDVGKELTDTARGTDTVTKDASKVLDDTSAIAESISKDTVKSLGDIAEAIDVITLLIQSIRTFDEAPAIADEFSRTVNYIRSGATHNLTDISRGTDAISKEPQKRLGNVYASIEQDKLLSEYLNIPDDIQEKQTLTAVYTPTDQNTSRATDARTKQIGVGLTNARGGSRYSGTFGGGEFILNFNYFGVGSHLLETAAPTSDAWLAIKTFEVGQVGVIIDTTAPGIGREYPFTVVSWEDEPTREFLRISSNIDSDTLENFEMDIIVRPTSLQTATRATDTITTKRPGKVLGDIARGTDEFTRVVDYVRAGAGYNLVHISKATDADTIQYTKVAGGEGTAGLTDFVGLDYNQELIFPKQKLDITRVSDSISNRPGKELSDTPEAVDTFNRIVTYIRSGAPYNLTDTARGTDELSRVVDYVRAGAPYTLNKTARATDVVTRQPNKALFDTARGTDVFNRVVNYIRSGAPYSLDDTARGTDVLANAVSLYAGGEATYVELDVAGIGPDLSAEISQNYNKRSLKVTPFVNLITTGSGANGQPTGAASTVSYTSSPYIPTPTFLTFVNNGYFSFVAQTTGPYTFEITGAAGGVYTADPPTTPEAPTINGYKRAPGARVVGTVNLNASQTVTIVIGQGGGDDTTVGGVGGNPGGGGGTFVTSGSYAQVLANTDTLFFAAGGGGGGGGASIATLDNYTQGRGQSTTAGSSTTSGPGGTGGNGASSAVTNLLSGGGGGYLTGSGGNTVSSFGAAPANLIARGFRQGAVGGLNTGAVGYGGFGGGGSGSGDFTTLDLNKGGGGGYSGGAALVASSSVYAGGGGSYAIGAATNVTITPGGGTTYNGSVVIYGNIIPLTPYVSTYLRADQQSVSDLITTKDINKELSHTARGTDTISKDVTITASGSARTRLTEFTPINYTQDLLEIIQPDL